MSRIAVLLPNLRGGGVERVRLILSREFIALGYDIDFVLMQAVGDLLPEVPPQVRVIDLGASRLRALSGPLKRYLDTEKPAGVIAAIWPLTVGAVIGRKLARHKPRLVVSDHNNLTRQYASQGPVRRAFLQSSIRLAYPSADARVAVSAGVADDLAALSGLQRTMFEVIHNPLPARAPVAQDEIERADHLWGPRRGPRILCVGSFKAQKNLALAISATAALKDATLMLIGDGELRPRLIEQAKGLGIADRVKMPGFFANPEPFYKTADVFVLSSDYEGFGNVIVEALAAGLPVVSTDCPSGPAEILENGRYGVLTRVGDVEALANGIREALAGPAKSDQLRARAASFSPRAAAQTYLDLLFPPDHAELTI